ncbi:hypothetical protein D3C76_1746390 [compost metagenome]
MNLEQPAEAKAQAGICKFDENVSEGQVRNDGSVERIQSINALFAEAEHGCGDGPENQGQRNHK